MRTNVLSPSERRNIIRRARAGESYAELGREFGVTTQAISYHARKAFGPRPSRKVTNQSLKRMRRAWDEGQTAREIGERFGLSERTVSFHMTAMTGRGGRLNRKPNFFPPHQPEDIAYLAAMLDAEGCIYRGENHTVFWRVSITGSSPALIEWLSQWGGRVYKSARQERTGSRRGLRKQVYVWSLTAVWDIAVMLDEVLPLMIEKQGKAVATVEEIIARHGSPPWALGVRAVAAER